MGANPIVLRRRSPVGENLVCTADQMDQKRRSFLSALALMSAGACVYATSERSGYSKREKAAVSGAEWPDQRIREREEEQGALLPLLSPLFARVALPPLLSSHEDQEFCQCALITNLYKDGLAADLSLRFIYHTQQTQRTHSPPHKHTHKHTHSQG